MQSFWMEGRPFALDGDGPTDVPYNPERAADFERVGGFEVIAQTARENPDKVAVDDGQDRADVRSIRRPGIRVSRASQYACRGQRDCSVGHS